MNCCHFFKALYRSYSLAICLKFQFLTFPSFRKVCSFGLVRLIFNVDFYSLLRYFLINLKADGERRYHAFDQFFSPLEIARGNRFWVSSYWFHLLGNKSLKTIWSFQRTQHIQQYMPFECNTVYRSRKFIVLPSSKLCYTGERRFAFPLRQWF